MGNTLSGEYRSTWGDDDVQEWKATSKELLTAYYLGFSGSVFHDWSDLTRAQKRAKICYALYGPPQEEADSIESAYSDEQREGAAQILNKIIEVWKKAPEPTFCVGIILVHCKEDTKDYCMPVFRMLWQQFEKSNIVRFIDTSCRVYNSWTDWKDHNTYPMMKYCYPLNGYFSCSDSRYQFDVDEKPVFGFGTSPACDLTSRLGRVCDVTATIGGFVASAVGLAALFTPIGLIAGPVLVGSGVLSGYGCGRSVQRLLDKRAHGESLTDLESLTLYFSIAATPLHFFSTLSNARLTAGAAQGSVFTSSTRVLATILNISTVSVDGALLLLGIANLIDKGRTGQVSTLDVLQLSMGVLFFSHTLMQPITANGIIQQAQRQRIQELSSTITDADARKAFQNYLERNQGMHKQAAVIRTLILLEDPNQFFSNVPAGPVAGAVNDYVNPKGNPRVKCVTKLNESLGVDDYKKFELNGKKIFENMDDRTKGRINKVFGGAAEYNAELVSTAVSLAQSRGETDANRFMSLIEVVAADTKGGVPINGPARQRYINQLNADITTATDIAQQNGLHFADPHRAVYHFRKHGTDFVSHMMEPTLTFYLGELPGRLTLNANLISVVHFCDGAIQSTFLRPDNQMAVVVENAGQPTISTMYRSERCRTEHTATVTAREFRHAVPTVGDASSRLAAARGLASMAMFVNVDGRQQPIEGVSNEAVHQHIIELLMDMADEYDAADGA